ncbi:MAG: hypothetical protein AB7V44_24010 [Pseudonocardia sp.]
MSDQTIGAFVDAVRRGDGARVREALAADVVLNSPIVADPITGPAAVSGILGLLAGVLGDLTFGEVLVGDSSHAVRLTGRIGERDIEAIEHLRLNADGEVDSITVLARPLESVVALQNRLASTLGMPPLSLVAARSGEAGER